MISSTNKGSNLTLFLLLAKIVGFLGVVLAIEPLKNIVLGVKILPIPFVSELATKIFFPPFLPSGSFMSLILAFFAFHIFWFCGRSLENLWGVKKFGFYVLFNLFVGAFLLSLGYSILGFDALAFTIFLAFSFSYPEQQFLFMFVIPVKARTLGIISLVLIFISLPMSYWLGGILIISNFVVFVIFKQFPNLNLPFQKYTVAKKKNQKVKKEVFIHECHFCGITDKDDQDIQFRISEDGNEYCQKHLRKEDR